MALTVVSTSGVFDPTTRDKTSVDRVLKLAMFGQPRFPKGTALASGAAAAATDFTLKSKQVRTAQTMVARTMGRAAADFTVKATTTDNSAASQVLDLTDQGVTFPTGTVRKLHVRSVAVTDNDRWVQEWEVSVLGGTTPAILGTARLVNSFGDINGTMVQYGVCHAAANYDSSDTAVTTTVGTSDVATSSTAGSSIGNIATNTATLTHPIARAGGKRVLGVNSSADVATATEQLLATVYPVNSTTMSIFTADTATPSADGFDDDGRLEVSFYILPPPSVAVVINTANVEVHCGHDASDVVTHYVEVYVGRAENIATIAD